MGQPGGVHLNNIFSFALAEEWHVIPQQFDIVAEELANTPSVPENPEGTATSANQSAVAAEAAGCEIVGMLGARYYVLPYLFTSLGMSYDNNQAVQFRPGVSYWFNRLAHKTRPG